MKRGHSAPDSGAAPPLLRQSEGFLLALLGDFSQMIVSFFYILLLNGQRKATCLAQGWAAVRDKGAAVAWPADPTHQSSAGSPGESGETSAAPQRLGDGCCIGLTGSLPQDGQFIILILEFPAVG